jgi:hypothetical protein
MYKNFQNESEVMFSDLVVFIFVFTKYCRNSAVGNETSIGVQNRTGPAVSKKKVAVLY